MKKLIGREREIKELDRCMASEQSEFVIVYGRRRVGKTFLVDEYFKRSYDFSYVGGHNLSNAKQLRNFAKAVKRYAHLPKQPKFADWSEAFDTLAKRRMFWKVRAIPARLTWAVSISWVS